MSTIAARLTVDDILALPEDETVRRELIEGEIVEMSWGGQPHEITKSNFTGELWQYFAVNPIGRAFEDTVYRLAPHNFLMPDVSVILNGRLDVANKSHISFAPDVAIEVVSSETAARLRTKVDVYLRRGCQVVWIAYPELRLIVVHKPGSVRELTFDDILEEPEVLPGFRVPVARLFRDM